MLRMAPVRMFDICLRALPYSAERLMRLGILHISCNDTRDNVLLCVSCVSIPRASFLSGDMSGRERLFFCSGSYRHPLFCTASALCSFRKRSTRSLGRSCTCLHHVGTRSSISTQRSLHRMWYSCGFSAPTHRHSHVVEWQPAACACW